MLDSKRDNSCRSIRLIRHLLQISGAAARDHATTVAQNSTMVKSSFLTSHSGQVQVSGISSQRVPGSRPSLGAPSFSE